MPEPAPVTTPIRVAAEGKERVMPASIRRRIRIGVAQ
jgi:hypothetical protein